MFCKSAHHMLPPPAPLLQPGNPLRISTRGESTAMQVTTTSCTQAKKKASPQLPSTFPSCTEPTLLLQKSPTMLNTPRAAQDRFWPLSVSLESTCCTTGCFCKKTYAKPRGFRSLC